jgi:hypothetical protein
MSQEDNPSSLEEGHSQSGASCRKEGASCRKYPRRLILRMTEAEANFIKASATQTNLSLSRFMVQTLTQKLPTTQKERDALDKLWLELHLVGENLWYITRRIREASIESTPFAVPPGLKESLLLVKELLTRIQKTL